MKTDYTLHIRLYKQRENVLTRPLFFANIKVIFYSLKLDFDQVAMSFVKGK